MSTPTVLYPQGDSLWQGDPLLSVTGTGDSIPWGVDAVFQYNELQFNYKDYIDKIVIHSIDGNDDNDIRDNREDNPAEEGETAFDAFDGGRTLVFAGRIEAYQRDKLRDMEMAFRTAFNDLNEKPLYYLTGDITKDHYINCRKSSKFQMTEEQKYQNHFFREFQLTLRASNPRFLKYQSKTISIDPDEDNQIDINNFGNYTSEPIITFFGGLSNVGFDLSHSGETYEFRLKSGVTIADQDFYRLDVAKKTLKNQAGENKFSDLDPDSDIVKFPAGASKLIIPDGISMGTSSNAEIQVIYRDSYK